MGGANRQAAYPSGNFFPTSFATLGFVDYNHGKYDLSASSSYNNAGTDKKDLGADVTAVNSAIAGVVLQ